MKRMTGLLAGLAVLAGIAFANTYTTVGTNSLQLVASKPVRGASNWASNTVYSAGDVVKNGRFHYMAVGSGTSSNVAPVHVYGDASDEAVTWRAVSPGTRNGLVISVKTSGGKVDLSFGATNAIANGGMRLTGEGHAIMFGPTDNYQGTIHAISVSGGDVVLGVQEF
jgi:hypothetical protein